MPYTEKQHRLFLAAAHNRAIARKHGMSMPKAREMAMEGVKREPKRKGLLGAKNGRSY